MGYYDEAEPSFAQRFGDWERVPQQATDALGRPLVLNAQGRSMTDAFEAFGMPMYAKITRDTLAMKEAEQARAQAGGSLEGTPALFAERFGDKWEPYARGGAALATGLGAAAVTRPRTQAVRRGEIPDAPDAVREAGPVASGMRQPPQDVATKVVPLYDPPSKLPRPFAADYPSGALTDDAGRLLADVEGRPLVAKRVVGRRMVGEPDQALPPTQLEPLATETTGRSVATATSRELRGDAGKVVLTRNPVTGKTEYEIFLNRNLTPIKARRTLGHEVSHVIEEIAGQISTEGLIKELQPVYSTLATGQERARRLTLPRHFGYSASEEPRELMVEAIRAYMADPNYLKTVAPKTASAIRAAVNAHPTLSKIIQFNTIVPAIAGGGALAAGALAPERSEATERWPSEDSALSGGDFAEMFSGRRKRPPL